MASFKTIAGGFELSPEQVTFQNKQRAITKLVNDRFIQVGAIWLKASSKNPYDEDKWTRTKYRDTDLQAWIDDPELSHHNVGFNLQLGWVDIDIDAEDPEFNRCVLAALDFLQIDTRFAFGRYSARVASHVMVQLGEEESSNFDLLTKFEPREFRISGKRYHVQIRSFATNTKAENVVKTAKQTVMPGSVYTHKTEPSRADISVWYQKNGKVAEDIRLVAATTPRKVNFNEIVRAVCFATFLYCVKDEWVEGSRQATAAKMAGWLARVVKDGAAMNNQEAIAQDVFCPVDCHETAESLLSFVCAYMLDDEAGMRIRTYRDAVDKLERNPDAHIAGWPAVEQLLGGAKVAALRTVFTPGSDVSNLTKMAERYLYDETDNHYIDRQRFSTNANYSFAADELERRHKGDVIRIGGKPRQAFNVFESSDMRIRIGFRDLYPDLEPGALYRISGIGDVLNDESEIDDTALTVFNTWRGWPVHPADVVDQRLMESLVARFDQLLAYLTRDNKDQAEWIKRWLAWTFQKPGDKQQIALVVVGDQGVGKSWLGNIFMSKMMGNLWGSASPKVLEGDFNIGPFKDKMFTFIDEAKFHSEVGTEEIKKLIRGVDVPGMEKFQEARNYRIFSRIMFASNRLDMNIGQANVRDRALFYTRAYGKDHLNMDEMQFRTWAEGLKPFFEEFTQLMSEKTVREHFMRMFMELPCDKHEIESIRLSSSGDVSIVMSNMSWPRRIARYIVEDGRIYDDLDISFPFTQSDFFRRVGEVCKELGMSSVQGARVMQEFDEAGMIERVLIKGQHKLRFKWKIGSLTEEFGKAVFAPLDPRFEFTENDYGLNDSDGIKPIPWKGNKPGIVAASKGREV